MTMVQPTFRRATPEDVGTLAEFVHFASEGFALYLWTQIAGPERDPWQIGRERLLRGTSDMSCRTAVIAEASGKPASGVIGYPLSDKPEPASSQIPEVLLPLHELRNKAPDTWYVQALAAYPEYRGRGHGSALLAEAETLAASVGKRSLSLVVSDTNTGARKLYERCGYREAAHCKMVKEQWVHPGTNWVLLRKDLSK
ncbi:GNAT family N-acetyltransferase [Bradyrhizobium sp. 170]|nr:GNAT family N-acetyltransferase [Bradyrhizobium sp. 170]